MPAVVKDITGKKFGRLTVVARNGWVVFPSGKKASWWCRCDCGNELALSSTQLGTGHTTSCGCLRAEKPNRLSHGHAAKDVRSRTYRSWSAMKHRCDNAKVADFRHYGGRGIKYVARWASFENFLRDMGECPPGMTIDRIDVNKSYSKENCRWATIQQQARNKRTSVHLTVNGVTRPLAEWCEISGLKYMTLYQRLRRGVPPEEAVKP